MTQSLGVTSEKDILKPSQRFMPPPPRQQKVDKVVSDIVGKEVFVTDSRLIKLIIKWKGDKSSDSTEPDNFLEDPKKIEELKQIFI